jgi:transcriptional regulator with GAF, ATPase, and Fis domain
MIHENSNRRDHGFLTVHCGTIPHILLESEFFGHEKGSFAGAVRQQPGKFENRYLKELLYNNNGVISKSAKVAGISPRQLGKLRSKYRKSSRS